MTMRPSLTAPAGWQILLADLSLILFIAAASALGGREMQHADPNSHIHDTQTPFSAATRGADLTHLLASYSGDARERLHIVVRYRPGAFADAIIRAEKLEGAAAAAGHTPKIVLEQSDVSETAAYFAFDHVAKNREEETTLRLAQGLQR